MRAVLEGGWCTFVRWLGSWDHMLECELTALLVTCGTKIDMTKTRSFDMLRCVNSGFASSSRLLHLASIGVDEDDLDSVLHVVHVNIRKFRIT